MPQPRPIKNPAGYVPAFAIGYSGADGELAIVDAASPLPVAISPGQPVAFTPYSPPVPAPLQGSASTSTLVGPFTPVAGKPVFLTLSGIWQGSVQIMRSTDNGTTLHPVTVAGIAWGRYSANACEPAWEEEEAGAAIYLDITMASGSVAYRLAQ